MTYDGPPYTKIRNDFLERKDLTAVEKLILQWLHGRFRKDGRPWEVNREQLSETLNLGIASVRSALKSLRDKGWLTDNSKPVRRNGRIVRTKSQVMTSRKSWVIADTESPVALTSNGVLRTSNGVAASKDWYAAGIPDCEFHDKPMRLVLTGNPKWVCTQGGKGQDGLRCGPDDAQEWLDADV